MTACCCGSGVKLCVVSESLCRAAEGTFLQKRGCEEGLEGSPFVPVTQLSLIWLHLLVLSLKSATG